MAKVKLDDTGKFSKRGLSLFNKKCLAIIKDTAKKNGVDESNIELGYESLIIKTKKKTKKRETTADKIRAIGFDETVEKYLLDKNKKGDIKSHNVKDILVAAENSKLLELSLDHQIQLIDDIVENRKAINDRNLKNIALIAAGENQVNTNVSEHLFPLVVSSAETLHEGLQQYENIWPDVSQDQSQYLKDILVKLDDSIKEIID